METIRVNMTPCEDVQTIHASQNDNEGREWGFELHNNGEKIDSSSISDQLVFKAYEGGTEEILPTNGSTPTTSPFKGDIKYPQGLLSDQEFLYRESPTEEDGNAKIKSLYGNTLVWNQLVRNGNFADTSAWQNYGSTFTVSGNTATVKTTNASNQFGIFQAITFKANHKYFISFEAKKHGTITLKRNRLSSGQEQVQEGLYRTIETASVDSTLSSPIRILFGEPVSDIANDYFMVKNYMIVDLTQMGLDITASEFTSLFPLSYYAYNQGTLLSFNGNGIKTVGKNRFYYPYTATSQTLSGVQCTIDTDGKITLNGTATSSFYINIFPNYPQNRVKQLKGTYTLGIGHTTIPNNFEFNFGVVINGAEYPSYGGRISSYNAKLTKDIPYDWEMFCNMRILQGASFDNFVIKPMLNFGNEALTFEPYTSSTLSLPISTYFSNGMKSAGTVYDELTPTKGITRIGAINLGSLNWYQLSARTDGFFTNAINPIAKTSTTNLKLIGYTVDNAEASSMADMTTKIDQSDGTYLYIINSAYASNPSGLKASLDGVYLYYELATPTETSFTTASLVTENAEIPLSNEDGTLIGKCTEQLSAEPGFHDAKIKLTDSDGDVYSNKIQLHVERSPQ